MSQKYQGKRKLGKKKDHKYYNKNRKNIKKNKRREINVKVTHCFQNKTETLS